MGVDLLAKYQGENSKGSLDPKNAGPCLRLADKPPRYVVFLEGDGKCTAVAYSLLQSLVYDAGVGLILRFGSIEVTIKGRNLKPAYQPFMDHLVQECLRGDGRYVEVSGLPFVEEFEFT